MLADRPAAYWRFEEFNGPSAVNSAAKTTARFEDGTAFYLPGVRRRGGGVATPPEEDSPVSSPGENHAVHFAGGRLQAENLVPGIDGYDAQANSQGKRITWGWVPWEEPIAIIDSAFVPQTEDLPPAAPISPAN